MQSELSLQQKKILGFTCIVLGIMLTSYLVFNSLILEEIENRSWDWRLRQVAKKTAPDSRIKIIGIDQSSLDYEASEEAISWPWPRALYVPIVEYLKAAGAKGVAFDIMFTEFSAFGEDDDKLLAKSFEGKLPVVVAAAVRSSEGRVAIPEERLKAFKLKQTKNNEETRFSERFPVNTSIAAESITLPITQFLSSAGFIGNVTIPNDSDGVFRHFISAQYSMGIPLLTLPFSLYNAVNPNSDPYRIPINDRGLATLRFAGKSETYKTYSFSSIINSYKQLEEGKEPSIALSEFKDSYVFVGMNAPGLLDLRPTPLDPKCPGVEVNATALDNLLNRKFIREASQTENLLFTLIFVTLAAGTAFFIQNIKMQLSFILLTFSCLVISTYWAATAGLWLQMVVPLISSSFALLFAVALQYRLEGAQTRFIKKAFRYYVSSEVIDKIIEDPSILSLGGDRKDLSIFFCDIAGFTSISESMDPSTLVQFLNKFLSAMTTIILNNGGTVDKYVGDAIVAFWNAPLPDPKHATRAVKAAVECQRKLDEMRPELLKQFGHDVRLRIGIHTGIASVGNFGSLERFNYTVIGDSANLASRLEGANKSFGTDILISDATYIEIKDDIACLRVAQIKVIGKEQAIRVYTPNRALDSSDLEVWNAAVASFETADFEKAKSAFASLPESKLRDFYFRRLELLTRESDLQNWSPTLLLTEK